MQAFNRRYAFLGWLVWMLLKRQVRQKARAAAPAVDLSARSANRPALALAFALAVGIGTFVALRLRDAAEDEGL